MPTQTKNRPASGELNGDASALLERHGSLIKEYEQSDNGGRKANLSRMIREVQLDMEMEGVQYDKWTKPGKPRRKPKVLLEAGQVKKDLAKLGVVLGKDSVDAETKKRANARIDDLLKRSQEQGLKGIKDPR